MEDKNKEQNIYFLFKKSEKNEEKKHKMQKISSTEIRNSLEQNRKIKIAWLISNLFDILKFFCFFG